MHRNKAVSQRVILILLVINLVLSAGIVIAIMYHIRAYETAGGAEGSADEAYETGQKYMLYIGLNDKDTYKQMISTSKAREIVDAICSKYTDGYTRLDATGGWTDPSGTLTEEKTLVYMFYDVDEENLTHIMDEALEALNQNSILVERDQSVYTYYSGTKTESEGSSLQNEP